MRVGLCAGLWGGGCSVRCRVCEWLVLMCVNTLINYTHRDLHTHDYYIYYFTTIFTTMFTTSLQYSLQYLLLYCTFTLSLAVAGAKGGGSKECDFVFRAPGNL